MDFNSEIDDILKYGLGEGCDRAMLKLMKEIRQIKQKIHVLKFLPLADFIDNTITKSNIDKDTINYLVFEDTLNDVNIAFESSSLRFHIENNNKKKECSHGATKTINTAVNNEIQGLGRVNSENFGSTEELEKTGKIKIKFNPTTIRDDIVHALIKKELISKFEKCYLEKTLHSDSSKMNKQIKL